MKEELRYIGQKIIENKYEISAKINALLDSEYTEKIADANIEINEVIEWRSHFIEYLGESLLGNNDAVRDKIKTWAEQTGEGAVSKGLPLTEALRVITCYRTLIWLSVEEYRQEMQFSIITVIDIGKIIDPLLDYAAQIFSGAYVEYHNQSINTARAALDELSVPVVPIAEQLAVLPLIGIIDTHRAKVLMESTLRKSSELKLFHLILDLSGVRDMDTMVAHEIFRIHDALRLIGVNTILTGIRPEIAQTAVNLGIDFSVLKTYANLKQALTAIGFTYTENHHG